MSVVTRDFHEALTADQIFSALGAKITVSKSPASARPIIAARAKSSEQYLAVAIGSLILCITAALIYQPGRVAADLMFATAKLYPTCSVEHDCILARPALTLDKTIGDGTDPKAALDPARSDAGASGPTGSFGVLVVPQSRWSNPVEMPVKGASAFSPASHRLSVAMAAAGPQPSFERTIAVKRAPPPGKASAARHRSPSPRHL